MIQLFVNHPPRMGETVLTPQGPGTVEDYRKADQMYVILLDWKLANNSPVRSYCQLDQIKKMPAPKSAASAPSSALETTHSPLPRVLKSGTAVDTFMGPGHVVEYRVKDAIYDVSAHAFSRPRGAYCRRFLSGALVHSSHSSHAHALTLSLSHSLTFAHNIHTCASRLSSTGKWLAT